MKIKCDNKHCKKSVDGFCIMESIELSQHGESFGRKVDHYNETLVCKSFDKKPTTFTAKEYEGKGLVGNYV